MNYRTLGRTDERVSAIGLVGYHLGKPYLEESESIRIIRTAIDSGVTFLDNSWDYYDGQSELRMGKALRNGYRHRAFLMTKIDGRDKTTAARQIDESRPRRSPLLDGVLRGRGARHGQEGEDERAHRQPLL